MGLSKLLVTSSMFGILALVAVPAHAQHRGGGGHGGGGGAAMRPSIGHAGAGVGAPRGTFAPRAVAPRAMAPRFGGPSRMGAPAFSQRSFGASRGFATRSVVAGPRGSFAAHGAVGVRAAGVHAVGVHGVGVHGVGGAHFAPHFVGPRIVVSPFRFARPFYAFHPRFSLGFGLWVGFPIAYPYYGYPYYGSPYPYPYPYASSYPYGYADPYASAPYGYAASTYPPSYPASSYPTSSYPASTYPTSSYPAQGYPASSRTDAQGLENAGGVSFEIRPSTAAVFVDGTSVGTVAEFSPTTMPLTLTPGRHHIELRLGGYETMSFDVDVVAGQVIPYRGDMVPRR
jgi:PEGA domain-containing protein